MDITKQYFNDEIKAQTKLNKKIAKFQAEERDVADLSDQLDSIKSKMSKKFKQLYELDYSITGSEVAKLLDVSEYYLFLKLKDKLDFIVPPREAFGWVTDSKLKRKKVFVSKSSVYTFLKEHIQVVMKQIQVVVDQDELNAKLSIKASNKLIEEFKASLTDDGKTDKDKMCVKYTTLSDDVIEQILKDELSIYSAQSIKDYFIRTSGTTVHNTQFYRFMDNKAEYSKLIIQSVVPNLKKKNQQQSLVRYLLDVDPQVELFINSENKIVFSIDAEYYYEEIKDDFIKFANDKIEKKDSNN